MATEGRISYLESAVIDIKKTLENGVELRVQNASNITAINSKIDAVLDTVCDFKEYQKACDMDRNKQAKAIESLEAFRKRQIWYLGGITVFLGWLSTGGAKVMTKVLAIFS